MDIFPFTKMLDWYLKDSLLLTNIWKETKQLNTEFDFNKEAN